MSKWKTVIENNNYEINEQGKIRRKETKHILKPAKIKNGYSTGSICGACKGNLKTAYKSKWEYVE